MNILEWNSDGATVELTRDELDALRNGLNEARLLLKSDFETRIFVSKEEAGVLIKSLQRLLTDMAHADETPTAQVKRTG